MMTSKCFHHGANPTTERNSWNSVVIVSEKKKIFQIGCFLFGFCVRFELSERVRRWGWWWKLKSFPFKLFNYVSKQLLQLQRLELFKFETQVSSSETWDEKENCVNGQSGTDKLQKSWDMIDKNFLKRSLIIILIIPPIRCIMQSKSKKRSLLLWVNSASFATELFSWLCRRRSSRGRKVFAEWKSWKWKEFSPPSYQFSRGFLPFLNFTPS